MTNLNSLVGFGAGGGGGGSTSGWNATPLDSKDTQSYEGDWTVSTTYTWIGRGKPLSTLSGAGIKGNNTIVRMFPRYNSSTQVTKMTGIKYSVNMVTGAITEEYSDDIWTNNSGACTSTIWFRGPLSGGCGAMGGHICWPGYSSHRFGNGYWCDTGTSFTGGWNNSNADHGYNGNYYLPQTSQGVTSYFCSSGYDANSSNHNRVRMWSHSANQAPSASSYFYSGSYTSTAVGNTMFPAIDASFLSGNNFINSEVVHHNASNRRKYKIAANSSYTYEERTDSGMYYDRYVQLSNGKWVMVDHGNKNLYLVEDYNQTNRDASRLIDASPKIFGQHEWSTSLISIGNDEFLASASMNNMYFLGDLNYGPIVRVKFFENAAPKITGFVEHPKGVEGVKTLMQGFSGSYTSMFPLWETESSTAPKYIAYLTRTPGQLWVLEYPTFTDCDIQI